MTYPHLTPETANECSRAAYAYSPECYCIIYWAYADYPPRLQYHGLAIKWLCASVYRTGDPEQGDRYVLGVNADTGPDLLRNLRGALEAIASGERPDPSLLASDQQQRLISGYLAHPMLPVAALRKAVADLLPRLPQHEVRAMQAALGWALSERLDEVYNPPEGNGWIASAAQTTEALRCWPV